MKTLETLNTDIEWYEPEEVGVITKYVGRIKDAHPNINVDGYDRLCVIDQMIDWKLPSPTMIYLMRSHKWKLPIIVFELITSKSHIQITYVIK